MATVSIEVMMEWLFFGMYYIYTLYLMCWYAQEWQHFIAIKIIDVLYFHFFESFIKQTDVYYWLTRKLYFNNYFFKTIYLYIYGLFFFLFFSLLGPTNSVIYVLFFAIKYCKTRKKKEKETWKAFEIKCKKKFKK